MTRAGIRIDRSALVDRILGARHALILIEAPAGMGKSWLLGDVAARAVLGLRVEDRGNDTGATGKFDPAPGETLVIAQRPGSALPGHARRDLYGDVLRIGADDLLATEADLVTAGMTPDTARRRIAATGGWPCLIPVAPDPDTIERFVIDELLAPLSADDLLRLDASLRDGAPAAPGLLPPAVLHAVAPILRRAVDAAIDARAASPDGATSIARAQAASGDHVAAILTYQRAGAWTPALQALADAGGHTIIHGHGAAVFDRLLSGFASPDIADDPTLVLCRSMQAVKRGDARLARRILHDRWGPHIDDPRATDLPVEARFFRMLLHGWEDFDIGAPDLDADYAILTELGAGDDLGRGSFYNAVLEVYIRTHRFAEADHAAILAMAHYARTDVPILSFYIALHRAMLRMLQGDPADSARSLGDARAHLSAVRFDSPGDARLLSLLAACIDYERGRSDALMRFLSMDLDDLFQGELWPSLAEMVIAYGAQALSEHRSTMAARGFLDRWRVLQERALQFRLMIDTREVAVLQNANRWIEAGTRAMALSPDTTADGLIAQGADLARLTDRDAIALAVLWLRQITHDTPRREGLPEALDGILGNPRLTYRQRLAAELWRAEVLRRRKRPGEARAQALRALETAARLDAIASVSDERATLDSLTTNRRIRDALDGSAPVRRLLRRVQEARHGRLRRGRAHGLTRQETRILHGLGEGVTNKAIANAMGLSEATVKFHLRNLYAKLGCATRAEAVRSATELRLFH